jgi:hypothetical protein
MVLPRELDPQGQQDAGDVAAAVDGVAARDQHQRLDRVGFGGESSASSARCAPADILAFWYGWPESRSDHCDPLIALGRG